MRIAVPVADGLLSMHFGHCERFAFFDTDPQSGTVLESHELDAPEHQPGLLPRWLSERGAQIVIAGGMGHRAQTFFADFGIDVLVGAQVDTAEWLVASYLNGTLRAGENICDH